MADDIQEVRRALGGLDPAGPAVVTEAERDIDLARILNRSTSALAHHQAAAWWRPRLVLAIAGAGALAMAAAVAVVVGPFGPPPAPAYAATPSPLTVTAKPGAAPAGPALRELAELARAQERPDGAYEHLVINSWHLWSEVDGERVTSAVVPARHERWRAPDDSGRSVSRFEAPVFTSAEGREAWDGGLAPDDEAFEPRAESWTPGNYPAARRDRPPAALPEFTEWLAIGHPREIGPAETVVAVTDLARERVLAPTDLANALTVLADLPGLTAEGTVVDRAGRAGVAFSLESDHGGLPTRHTVIVDPSTGRLLGHDETLTADAGKLDVRAPAVIGYETYVTADFTSTIG